MKSGGNVLNGLYEEYNVNKYSTTFFYIYIFIVCIIYFFQCVFVILSWLICFFGIDIDIKIMLKNIVK